ncbi:uncharacterized protein LOC129761510 [Toxorhynchites rutilus septentrionalis]|uniref:uncharacterized protein LOC129761510 n=1 Tax=Toxorhynchites rutilus septentrionalis TaxID=329112 RepID=UPI00247A79EF|nr:uncharacterized protein LOC129761510 [Toxorhynchites rutilus septentrionalis]
MTSTENTLNKAADNGKKLNVGNLPADVTEQELRDHFDEFTVENIEIFHYLKYTLALLLFKDKDTATKALKAKDGSMFRNRRLRMHIEYIAIWNIKKNVFVHLVNEDTTEEQVYDKFKDVTEITGVLVFHPLAYVSCKTQEEKEAAIKELNTEEVTVYDLTGHDQNHHIEIWRAAKLFFRNLHRVSLINLPENWVSNQEELKKAVESSGKLLEVKVINNSHGAVAQLFYEDEATAKKAAQSLNQQVFEGKRIHALHVTAALIPNYKTSVYLTSLDKSVSEEAIYDQFVQFGEIEFVSRRKCADEHAIICFKNVDAVEKALECKLLPVPKADSSETEDKAIGVKRYNGPLIIDLKPSHVKKLLEDGEESKMRPPPLPLAKLWPIYVSNLPYTADKRDMRDYFSSVGGHIKFIFSPNIPAYKTSQTSMVMAALIYYARREQATDAIKAFNGKHFQNRCLHVFPGRKDTYFNPETSVRLVRLTIGVSEEKLFEKFRKFGFIECVVKRNRNTALIEFRDKEVCDKVLQLPDGEKPVRCGIEPLTNKVNRKIFKENDEKISLAMQEIIDKNPAVLENVQSTRFSGPPPLKRGRFNGPDINFGNPGNRNDFGSNSGNNDFSNPQVIQDLLRLAFISGKSLGEGLASGNNPFNSSDPSLSSLNLANGFSGRNFSNTSSNGNYGNSSGNRNSFGNQNNASGRNNFGGQNQNRNNNGGGNFGGQKRFDGTPNNSQQNRNQNQNRQSGGNPNRRF